VNGGGNGEDILNEMMAGGIFEDAGFKQAATRRASAAAPEHSQWMAQRHWGEEHGDGGKIIGDPNQYMDMGMFDMSVKHEVVQGFKDGPDPGATTRMMIFDYLIHNQRDRHAKNFLVVDHGGGKMEMGVIDQGLAFGAIGNAIGGKWANPKNMYDLDFRRFFANYRGDEWGIAAVIGEIAGDRDTLRKQMLEALDGFDKVNVSALGAKLKSQHVRDKHRQEWIEDWLGEFEFRRDWMRKNLDDALRLIATRGGI
jgi:hypothetical protein